MKLVIVESPTKARKLRQYLGDQYKIEASVGHVRDLPKSELGVDVANNFAPTYVISPDKKKVIAQLKKLAAQADEIILATDPDREGEAIAWHLMQALDAPESGFARASFHEITKPAVLAAISESGHVNQALVDAQQARRIVDRLVGYEASPVLWRKVRRGLSAGRVQSVALRLIVEREQERDAFVPEEYWEVDVALAAVVTSASKVFVEGKAPAALPAEHLIARVVEVAGEKYTPHADTSVMPLLAWLPQAAYVVQQVEKKERSVVSLPPFTTSTLQQAAANRLGLTSKQTMRLAQQLYEEGLITYHRTDSVNLASEAVAQARAYIQKTFGADFVPERPRFFANRSKNAQEAHEAIRVTTAAQESVEDVSSHFTTQHQRLYDLIRRRFLASQMAAAVFDQATILVQATGPEVSTQTDQQAVLRASGSVLKFAGWKQLFPSQDDVILPDVAVDQTMWYVDSNGAQKFTQPPARFNDASLVKELEKRGIGRPSTYASIISVILDRGYVERIEKRFAPTTIGIGVCAFLLEHFGQFMEYDFTAEMEEDLDRISRGEKEWTGVVKAFYEPFHATVEKTLETAERVQLPVEKTGESCPECGQTEGGEVVIRTGKFGKFKSCSRFPECRYTENIVELVEGVKCPLCQQGDVITRKSRWGKPFFGCSRYPECPWASWKKPEPGERMSQAEWEEQQAKREERKAAREAKYGKKEPAAQKMTKKKSASKTKSATKPKRKKATTAKKRSAKKV